MKMSSIIVFKEKHDNRYFVVNGIEDKKKVALKILRERESYGYWYPSLETIQDWKNDEIERFVESSDKALLDLSDDEVEKLPDTLKNKVVEEKTAYQKKLKSIENYYNADIVWREKLDELLSAPDDEALKMVYVSARGHKSNLALTLLNIRNGYEYESYEEVSAEEF